MGRNANYCPGMWAQVVLARQSGCGTHLKGDLWLELCQSNYRKTHLGERLLPQYGVILCVCHSASHQAVMDMEEDVAAASRSWAEHRYFH